MAKPDGLVAATALCLKCRQLLHLALTEWLQIAYSSSGTRKIHFNLINTFKLISSLDNNNKTQINK